ncbi:MAG: hypothetical protein OXN27_17830 [Candidatus Poribacteria bacterium]|nr:hypothetical protein [Candidatus Poribacteria bacterium]MDE0325779.1 hypothetical protein [Candidatus Poribacteria bacterium]
MQQLRQPSLFNLSLFGEEFFRDAIQYHAYEYWTHFQNRLVAIYVGGSVHRNEAVPGVSDLDLYPFIIDEFNDADKEWFNQAEQRVESRYPSANGFCPPRSATERLDGLQSPVDEIAYVRSLAWVHRLRYDTTLVLGDDLIGGLGVPDMDKGQARDYFQSVLDLVRYAAGLETENKTDFRLPKVLPHRLRKLARLAVLGGAYLLIGDGESYSFKGTDIFPLLNSRFPHWRVFLNDTERLYIFPDPSATDSKISAYLSQLVPWVDWVGEQLRAA